MHFRLIHSLYFMLKETKKWARNENQLKIKTEKKNYICAHRQAGKSIWQKYWPCLLGSAVPWTAIAHDVISHTVILGFTLNSGQLSYDSYKNHWNLSLNMYTKRETKSDGERGRKNETNPNIKKMPQSSHLISENAGMKLRKVGIDRKQNIIAMRRNTDIDVRICHYYYWIFEMWNSL